MHVSDLGEFKLIESISRMTKNEGDLVSLGIGDDAAVLRISEGREFVISVDAFFEGVHFQLDRESPRRIGSRALLASLSDLSAMGAEPIAATLAAGFPRSFNIKTARSLARGVVEAGNVNECPLVGGNLSRAKQVSLTVTVVGSVEKDQSLRRDRARVGHRVFVTGRLGEMALARGRQAAGTGRKLPLPLPRWRAGSTLSRIPGVGACIDLSDGLIADLEHVHRASKVGAELDWDSLPRSPRFENRCQKAHLAPASLLLAGGEDYELLFTGGGHFPSAPELTALLKVPVAEIGKVVEKGLRWTDGVSRPTSGWRHF